MTTAAAGEFPAPPAWVFRSATPKAMSINFESAFRNLDSSSRQELGALTTLRRDMVRALDGENADATLTALDSYLPRLLGVLRAAEGVSVEMTGLIAVSWYQPFTSRFTSSPAVTTSLRYEHAMVLFAAALMHRKKAVDLLASCSGSTDGPEFKMCAAELSKAAGMFEFLAAQPLSGWAAGLKVAEMSCEFCGALASLCLLEHQGLSIRKAFAAGASAAVLAKLCAEAARRASATYGTLAELTKAAEATTGDEPRINAVKWYVGVCAAVFRAAQFRTLAAEQYRGGAPGQAIGYIKAGLPTPQEDKLLADRRVKEMMPTYLAAAMQVLDHAKKLYESWSKENDTVYFEAIPEASALTVPDPVAMAKSVPYADPAPIVPTIHFQQSACEVQ